MQADLGAAIHGGAWTVVATVGARGRTRSASPSSDASTASDVAEPSLGSYVISREHYVMWRPDEAAGVYVRAGRFMAPYGLRLADHTAYVWAANEITRSMQTGTTQARTFSWQRPASGSGCYCVRGTVTDAASQTTTVVANKPVRF